jgi:hypothetical protein
MKSDFSNLERAVIASALMTNSDARSAILSVVPRETFWSHVHSRLVTVFVKYPDIDDTGDIAKAAGVEAHEVVEIAGDWRSGTLVNALQLLLNERFTEAAKQKLDTRVWAEAIVAVHAARTELVAAKAKMVIVTSLESFQAKEFPPAVDLLSPIIHENSLNMVFASRGQGKTFFALSLAYAIATGGQFLRWKAEKPRKVLYIDGEMPAGKMQERLARIAIMEGMGEYSPEYFNIITPDMQPPDMPMPDLSTAEGQAAIDAVIAPDTALIVVDNLSCLCRTGRENESESWIPVQGWALRQRRNGRAVLFVHHAGKNGEQRGSGKKEDLLDVVIELRKQSATDGQEKTGASFELHFSKGRHLEEKDKQPLVADLSTGADGALVWAWAGKSEDTFYKVVDMANSVMSQSDIARALGISRQAVNKHWKQAETEGLISKPKQ